MRSLMKCLGAKVIFIKLFYNETIFKCLCNKGHLKLTIQKVILLKFPQKQKWCYCILTLQ
jgi:hypothetical protein